MLDFLWKRYQKCAQWCSVESGCLTAKGSWVRFYVCMGSLLGYSGFQKHAKLGISFVSHSKFPVGVSVDGCLSVYVTPAMN